MRRIAGVFAVTVGLALPAAAEAAVTPTRAAGDLAAAMATPKALAAGTTSSFTALPPLGDPHAVSNGALSDFPRDGGTYAILTSGDAKKADPASQSEDDDDDGGQPDPNDASRPGVFDLSTLKLDARVPEGVNCLVFTFRFLTNEQPGDTFNDGFIAELDTSDWTTDALTGDIDAPHNFASDEGGHVMSVNSPGSTSLSPENADGTGYENGSTRLTAATSVTPGAHSLFLSIFDGGDAIIDSAVFIDGLDLIQAAEGQCVSGARDDVAPTLSVTAPATGSAVADATPTLAGTAGTAAGDSQDVAVELFDGAGTAGTPRQTLRAGQQGGRWAVAAATLPEGIYTVRARQSDAVGNVGTSLPSTFRVDTTAPRVTLTAPADGTLTDDATPTLAGAAGTATGDAGQVTVQILSGAALVQALTTPSTGGAWSVATAALAPGTYTARAEQLDSAGNVGTSAARAFTVDAPPEPDEQDIEDSETERPEPVLNQTVVAGTVSGTIRVKGRDGKYRPLGADESIPLGSTVDATKGKVRLTSASGPGGAVQSAVFYQGVFKVTQTRGSKPITQLALAGALRCPRASTAGGAAATQSKRRRVRRLWGDGRGRFRTKGRHGAATVRGTKWLTEDRCNGTLVRVKRGKVSVRDFAKRKTVIVKKGKSYFAAAKRAKSRNR